MANLQMIIKAKGNERMEDEQKKADDFYNESVRIRDHIISTYGKRVGKMLSVMRTIRDNDPLLWNEIKYDKFIMDFHRCKKPTYFYTSGIEHNLGFKRNLSAIGQEGGGANGQYDFIVTEDSCEFNMYDNEQYGNWTREKAKNFDNSFPSFEHRFIEFINNQYGENAYNMCDD